MTRVRAARLDPLTGAAWAWPGVGLLLLAVVGYLGASDLRIPAALITAVALAAWIALAYERPRLVTTASFLIVLIAGTKFRMRDPTASLDAVMDAQILLEIGLFALVGVGLLAVWIGGDDRRGPTKVEAVILGYTAIALLSTFWSLAPALTLVRATQLVIVSALAILAVRVLSPSGALSTACTAVALYVVACAGLAAIFPWASGAYYDDDGPRFAWFSVHPVAAGTLAAIGALGVFSASVFARPHDTHRHRGITLSFCAICLVLLLALTNSRGPLLAFVAGVGLLMLLRVRELVRIPLMLAAASCGLLCLALGPNIRLWLVSLANQDSAMTRLFFRGQSVDAVLGLSGRLALWDDLRPAIAAHSLFGYGYQASRSVVLDAASWAAYAHNALLQTILDLGLVGTSALGAIVIIGLCRGLRSGIAPCLRATVATLMVFLMLNSISTESFAGAPGFETLLLFVCALCAASGQPKQAVAEASRISPTP